MTIRFANATKLIAVLSLLAGSTAAQNVRPTTVRNLLNGSAESAHVQGPSAGAVSSAKPVPSKSPAQSEAKPAEPGAAPASAEKGARRDPFDSLLYTRPAGGGESTDNLPPGKPGLVINSLRIDGIIKGQNGMIAVVTNAQQRVYFIHEGDKLYDGSVEHITLEAVSFHELGKDAFGKPTDTEVTKRLYPSPGEQQ